MSNSGDTNEQVQLVKDDDKQDSVDEPTMPSGDFLVDQPYL